MLFRSELFVLCAAPAWLLAARDARQNRWSGRQLLLSGAGALAVFLAVVVFLLSQSALDAYVDLLRFYRAFAANFCIDRGRFPRVSGIDVVRPSLQRLNSGFYNLANLAFVVPLLGAALFSSRRVGDQPSRRAELVVAMASLGLGMIAVSVGHCFWKHYYLMGVAGVLLPAVTGCETVTAALSSAGSRLQALAMALFISSFAFVAAAPVRQALAECGSVRTRELEPILAETISRHSGAGDYILTTEGPLVYLLADRKNPLPLNSFFDAMIPYLPRAHPDLDLKRLDEQLEQHLPKVVHFSVLLHSMQARFRELLLEPLLARHGYVRVTDQIWYLPDASSEKRAAAAVDGSPVQ